MHRDIFIDSTTTYTRISKREARKVWGHEDIALCACHLRPGYPWARHLVVKAAHITEGLQSPYDFERDAASFDTYVRDFESYNCTGNGTGRCAAFYRLEKWSADGA